MKTIKKILVLLVLLASISSYSQAINASDYGYYKADMNYIYSSNSTSFNTIRLFSYSSGRIEISNNPHAVEKTIHEKNVTTYTWVNSGGIWSESQTWVFTKNATNGIITVMFMRVVQNEGQDPWYVIGTGNLTED